MDTKSPMKNPDASNQKRKPQRERAGGFLDVMGQEDKTKQRSATGTRFWGMANSES